MFPKRYSYANNAVVYHALFWVIYFLVNILRWGSYYDDYLYSLRSNAVEFPLHIILVYFNIYVLMPRLIPKKVGLYIGALIISVFITVLLKGLITYNLVTTDLFKESPFEERLFGINYLAASFIGEVYVVGVVTAIKMTIDWVKFKDKAADLAKTNLETELAYLKSQIQPHFFFNTLNNLYSLTLDKSDKAPETVLKLSELMSYVIYEAKEETVSLTNEINHIQNYIDLEKLRYGDKLKLTFDVSGDISGVRLPPILFLPFIENCFKHGTKTRSNEIPISIGIKVDNGWITFTCKNEVTNEEDVHKKLLDPHHNGVGLTNTERRLKLRYPDNYDLNIEKTDTEYSVTLKIPSK
ncbi:MAG: histidine kinase [Roseivirga sp.]